MSVVDVMSELKRPEWERRLYVTIKYVLMCVAIFALVDWLFAFFLGQWAGLIAAPLAMITTNELANHPRNRAEHNLFTPNYIHLSEVD